LLEEEEEEKEVLNETYMGSIIDLILYIRRGLRIRFYQKFETDDWMYTDLYDEAKIDPNTIRMREAKTMKDALMLFVEALKTRGLLNSIYSMDELNRFFSILESKVLRHLFMEDFMTRNTFFEWLHDLKEFIRRQMSTLDTSNVDCEIFTSSPELIWRCGCAFCFNLEVENRWNISIH